MSKIFTNKWNNLFCALLVLHLTAILFQHTTLIALSKPLVLCTLFWGYYFQAAKFNSVNRLILAALFFSWLGDTLLLLQETDKSFFLLGLAAFLTAHIFYILYFSRRIKSAEVFNVKVVPVILMSLYAISLVVFLFPKLGELKIPVMVYALTITVMVLSAIHAFNSNNITGAMYCITGAVLFAISDSLLAINKFHTPFPAASFLIMLTYGAAQLFLVTGILQAEKAATKQ